VGWVGRVSKFGDNPIVKKLLLGISAAIAVVGLLGAILIFKVSPDTNVELIGYQYAVREDISDLPNIAAPAGYTSLNTQSFFSGKERVKKLALSIVEGQTTELGKAQVLIEWVQLHVRPQTSAPTTVITDDYVNIIKRGWGYCDQMAHVFATMATYVGLEAEQLQLFKDDGVSPHTLAMVKIDGKWRIASTWRGVIPKNSKGEPYTKTGFIHRLEKGDVYELAPIGPTEFENAKSLKTFPYVSNWQVGVKVVNRAVEKVKSLSSSSSSSSDLAARVQISASDLEVYDRARNAHLDMNYELAQNLYSQVIMTSTSIILKDEAKFASGMALYDAQDYTEALASFNKIVAGDKNSAWHISARRMAAETLMKMGKVKEALVILDSIGTPQSKVRAFIIRGE
jgi:hypothetical protein